jgi:hypothetical protein
MRWIFPTNAIEKSLFQMAMRSANAIFRHWRFLATFFMPPAERADSRAPRRCDSRQPSAVRHFVSVWCRRLGKIFGIN